MSSENEGYVHRPGEDGAISAGDGTNPDASSASDATPSGAAPDAGSSEFGARGWILVAVLAVCTLVVPGIIYVRPGILSAIGIPYIVSLLALPLLPAAALGLTAVWAMTATKEE